MQSIKFQAVEVEEKKLIPEKELDSSISEEYKELLKFNKGKAVHSSFGNSKRFCGQLRYQYYDVEDGSHELAL